MPKGVEHLPKEKGARRKAKVASSSELPPGVERNKFLPLCEKKTISVIIGGPYNSGILATGAVEGTYYNYRPAPPNMLAWVRQIEAVCARHGVALQAAALQFPFGHPAVTSIIPGARSVAEVQANIAYFQLQIPADFWAELKRLGLIDPTARVPPGNASPSH